MTEQMPEADQYDAIFPELSFSAQDGCRQAIRLIMDGFGFGEAKAKSLLIGLMADKREAFYHALKQRLERR